MAPISRTLRNWSPEAIVFDCDGTLMDTERHWQDARTRAFREFGLPTPPGFAERAKGVHYLDCGRLMAQETNKPDLATDLAASLLRHFLSLVAEDPLTMPGASEFVRLCARRLPWPSRATAHWRSWTRAFTAPGCDGTSGMSSCPRCSPNVRAGRGR